MTVGEVITNNARVFKNIPLKIAYTGADWSCEAKRSSRILILKRSMKTIEDVDAKYKNPRNLCSGSVRQLNNRDHGRKKCTLLCICSGICTGCGFA